jgi:hypothetical protein
MGQRRSHESRDGHTHASHGEHSPIAMIGQHRRSSCDGHPRANNDCDARADLLRRYCAGDRIERGRSAAANEVGQQRHKRCRQRHNQRKPRPYRHGLSPGMPLATIPHRKRHRQAERLAQSPAHLLAAIVFVRRQVWLTPGWICRKSVSRCHCTRSMPTRGCSKYHKRERRCEVLTRAGIVRCPWFRNFNLLHRSPAGRWITHMDGPCMPPLRSIHIKMCWFCLPERLNS